LTLTIFLNEVYKASSGKNFSFALGISSLILAVFTRGLFMVFIPVIAIGVYIFYSVGLPKSKWNYVPLFLLFLLLMLNVPSLHINESFSYEQKEPPKEWGVTWSQRQYLAQILVNEGNLNFQQHPSWEETREYLNVNGEESLPKSTIEGITY